MKSFAFRVVLLVFALSLVAVYVACDRGRQTTNQNQNTANSNENVAMTADKPPERTILGKKGISLRPSLIGSSIETQT